MCLLPWLYHIFFLNYCRHTPLIPSHMYSPVPTVSLGPDDTTSPNVSSLSSSSVSSASSSSLYTYPSSTSLLTEHSKKYSHGQSYSLSTLSHPSSISPPSFSSQFFPTQNGSLNSTSLSDSMGGLVNSSNSNLQSRSHHKSYGNHSVSNPSTTDAFNDRTTFRPTRNVPKSRSISVSSTEMFLPDHSHRFDNSSNMAGQNDIYPPSVTGPKFHSRSLSSSIPYSRNSLIPPSSVLSHQSSLSYSHGSSTDLKSNVIFENRVESGSTLEQRRNSYEVLPSAAQVANTGPSFLQAEITVDEFPILVRRESNEPAVTNHGLESCPVDMNQSSGYSDHHFGFAQSTSPSQSLTNSLNGSNQSLTSMLSSCSLQPHSSLAESTMHNMSMQQHQQHQFQPQHADMMNGHYSYSNNAKPVRAKSLKPPQRPYIQYAGQHLNQNHVKRSVVPQKGSQIPKQRPYTPQPIYNQGQANLYQNPSFDQQVHPAQVVENMPISSIQPTAVNRSVSVAFTPRHFNNNRRQHEADAASRFTDTPLESFIGDIYSICKDQHGCRYLQKVLDDRNETEIEVIFNETKDHITELMTDLFGNYLCQKLLERVNSEQRTVLVRNASPDLTKIALNQHGTRALQRMIEFAISKEQVSIIIQSLKSDVVRLIQDLNGNHVIQKCLNHLASEDSQFIIDAVSNNCVTVGTHRHGCCVLQRCIDHSSEDQRHQLITQIIANSFELVKDPFGNYVIQYVLELGIIKYSEALISKFVGHACLLSKQKFSSNVIEKCLRIALPETKQVLIKELVCSPLLDSLLRDSYANYVIQTTLEYADEATEDIILQSIIPTLPSIRNTPYGRKIISKLASTSRGNSLALAQLQFSQQVPLALPQPQQHQQQQHQQQQHHQQQHHQQQHTYQQLQLSQHQLQLQQPQQYQNQHQHQHLSLNYHQPQHQPHLLSQNQHQHRPQSQPQHHQHIQPYYE